MRQSFWMMVLFLALVSITACGPDPLKTEDEMTIVKSRIGEGTVILQRMLGPSEGLSFYLVCQPDGTVAIYDVFSNSPSVTTDSKPLVSWEKGSKYLRDKPGIEAVRCVRSAAVAQATPEPLR